MTLRHFVAYGLILILAIAAGASLILARRRQREAKRIGRGGRPRDR